MVRLLDFREEGGRLFLVMEFVAGERLAEVLDRGPLPFDRAAAIPPLRALLVVRAASRSRRWWRARPARLHGAPGWRGRERRAP
jgi:hypothetical protein